jgi:hypothetical protein
VRRILARIQGAASGALEIYRLLQRRKPAKRQASWDNSYFPLPLEVVSGKRSRSISPTILYI